MEIYVDGCMNAMTGQDAWASVTDKDGKDIVSRFSHLFKDMSLKEVKTAKGEYTVALAKFNDVSSQQNNGAELMAMLMALRIINESEKPSISSVHSDSNVVLAYWSKGNVNKATWNKMDPRKKAYIEECKDLRKKLEDLGCKFVAVPGSKNPADLGFHKK